MKPLYCLGRAVASLVYRLGGIRILGREQIPDDPSLLIVCNHVSYGDPIAVAMAYPRQIAFLAKEEFSRHFWSRWLFSAAGAVFVSLEQSSLQALRVLAKRLQAGGAVALFPEGTRRHDQNLTAFRDGAAYLAQRCQVRVLPMAVLNTGDYWRIWKRNVLVLVGKPLDPPPPGRPDKEGLREYTTLCHDQVAVLLEQGKQMLAAEGRPMRKLPRSRQGQYPISPDRR